MENRTKLSRNGKLAGKVAIITGAHTLTGEAIAHKFFREGASILLAGLSEDNLEDLALTLTEMGGDARSFIGDLAEEAQSKACIDLAIALYGRLDILIHHASSLQFKGEIQNYPTELYLETITAELHPLFYLARAAVPHLQMSEGCLVSSSKDLYASHSTPDAVDQASQSWIYSFIRGLAAEQAKYCVRANCISMGTHETDLAEEVANVFAFLASDEAKHISGALWSVDGGITEPLEAGRLVAGLRHHAFERRPVNGARTSR